MTRIRVPLSDQISYMERHREKGRELVKTNPGTQGAVDITEAIILTLTAYQAFEYEINARTK
jgi:hypothetical protein